MGAPFGVGDPFAGIIVLDTCVHCDELIERPLLLAHHWRHRTTLYRCDGQRTFAEVSA